MSVTWPVILGTQRFEGVDTIQQEGRNRKFLRFIFAIVCGILSYGMMQNSIRHGMVTVLKENIDSWGALCWGNHYILRFVAEMISVIWGSFVAGMVGRRLGRITAVLSQTYAILLLIFFAYLAWSGSNHIAISRYYCSFEKITGAWHITIYPLLLSIIPLAIIGGDAGAVIGMALADHFDSRRFTLLGIKWYHYLWIPIFLVCTVRQLVYMICYALGWLLQSWKTGVGISSILPNLLTGAVIWGVYMILIGLVKSFRVLASIESGLSFKERVWKVAKFGFGYPLCAVWAQTIVEAIVQFLYEQRK